VDELSPFLSQRLATPTGISQPSLALLLQSCHGELQESEQLPPLHFAVAWDPDGHFLPHLPQ